MKKIFAIGLFIVCFCVGCNFSKEDVMLDKNGVLIDVRTPEEFASGHIEGAINISHDIIGNNIAEVVPDKSTPIYMYCRSGRRVGVAMEILSGLGYTNMYNLGGFEEAKEKWNKE
jgi:phage shock protein E